MQINSHIVYYRRAVTSTLQLHRMQINIIINILLQTSSATVWSNGSSLGQHISQEVCVDQQSYCLLQTSSPAVRSHQHSSQQYNSTEVHVYKYSFCLLQTSSPTVRSHQCSSEQYNSTEVHVDQYTYCYYRQAVLQSEAINTPRSNIIQRKSPCI